MAENKSSLDDMERLFLLELLVDNVQIDYPKTKLKQADLCSLKQACVRFQFLNYPVLEVCEEDFCSTRGDYQKDKIEFKSGKSCLFSLRGIPVNRRCFEISVTVLRQKSDCSCVVLGKTNINLGSSFTNILTAFDNESNLGPVARTSKDTHPLVDEKGEIVGKITVFIRLSCFGKMIITQFQVSGEENKSFLFKGVTDKDTSNIKILPEESTVSDPYIRDKVSSPGGDSSKRVANVQEGEPVEKSQRPQEKPQSPQDQAGKPGMPNQDDRSGSSPVMPDSMAEGMGNMYMGGMPHGLMQSGVHQEMSGPMYQAPGIPGSMQPMQAMAGPLQGMQQEFIGPMLTMQGIQQGMSGPVSPMQGMQQGLSRPMGSMLGMPPSMPTVQGMQQTFPGGMTGVSSNMNTMPAVNAQKIGHIHSGGRGDMPVIGGVGVVEETNKDYKEIGVEINGHSLSIKVPRRKKKVKEDSPNIPVCGKLPAASSESSSVSSEEETTTAPPTAFPGLNFCSCDYPLPPGFECPPPPKPKKKKKKKKPKCPFELQGNYCLKPECPMGYPGLPSGENKKECPPLELPSGAIGLKGDQVVFQMPTGRQGTFPANTSATYDFGSSMDTNMQKVQMMTDTQSGKQVPLDPLNDVFLLKVGKKNVVTDKRAKMEMEIKSPRKEEKKMVDETTQCENAQTETKGDKGKKGKKDKKGKKKKK